MGDFFVEVFHWIQTLSPMAVYLSILLIAYGENLLPPVPGDMAIVLGGYLAGTGTVNFGLVVALSTLGGALGFMTMYAFGYVIGGAVMDPVRMKWIPKRRVRRAQQWVRRWGYGVVAANRFLSGLRSVISITVGMARMNAWITGLWSTVSAAVWTCLIAYVGYKVGESWETVSVWLRQYGQVVGTLILVFIIVQVVRYRINVRREGSQSGASAVGGEHFTES